MKRPLTVAERLEEAEERIIEFEAAILEYQAALRPVSVTLYDKIALSMMQALVLEMLFQAVGPIAIHSIRLRLNLTRNMVREISDDSVEMVIFRMRDRLRPHGIQISRQRGQGVYLALEDKEKLVALGHPATQA